MGNPISPHKATPLGRLLVPPPAGLKLDLAALIEALAREAAARDHEAETDKAASRAA